MSDPKTIYVVLRADGHLAQDLAQSSPDFHPALLEAFKRNDCRVVPYDSRAEHASEVAHLERAADYLYKKMTRNPDWAWADDLSAWYSDELIRRQRAGTTA